LVKAYGNGEQIQYDQFLGGLRKGLLSERRKNIVKLAFEAADQDGDGVLNLQEITDRYDVTFNSDFQEGRLSK